MSQVIAMDTLVIPVRPLGYLTLRLQGYKAPWLLGYSATWPLEGILRFLFTFWPRGSASSPRAKNKNKRGGYFSKGLWKGLWYAGPKATRLLGYVDPRTPGPAATRPPSFK